MCVRVCACVEIHFMSRYSTRYYFIPSKWNYSKIYVHSLPILFQVIAELEAAVKRIDQFEGGKNALVEQVRFFLTGTRNQRNEPHHEKERVKISNTAKFQSCRPNTREMVDIWINPKIRDKWMAVRLGWLFGQQLWKQPLFLPEVYKQSISIIGLYHG